MESSAKGKKGMGSRAAECRNRPAFVLFRVEFRRTVVFCDRSGERGENRRASIATQTLLARLSRETARFRTLWIDFFSRFGSIETAFRSRFRGERRVGMTFPLKVVEIFNTKIHNCTLHYPGFKNILYQRSLNDWYKNSLNELDQNLFTAHKSKTKKTGARGVRLNYDQPIILRLKLITRSVEDKSTG